ncbi:heparinase II/III family protein [Neobacillus niacini]|uniref:heparinase II/III domain-containing protein n=1 Tax=Neobacillus niacini TaxID=86668 RepID=UPI002FFEF2C1
MDAAKVVKTLKHHPRILFNSTEIQDIQVRVNQFQQKGKINFKNLWNQTLEIAEQYVRENEFSVAYPSINTEWNISLPLKQLAPVEDPPGYIDFPFWTMYSRAIEDRIKFLSFAYGMTGEKRFAAKVKEYLLSLSSFSRWYEFPHRGAEGNLSNAHFTLGMSMGYDAIFTLLTEVEKTTIKEAILTKGLQPFTIDFNNHDSHNIIASKQVAMLIGSLAVMDHECMEEVEPFLINSYQYIQQYLKNRMIDPEIEGLLYLNVAARHILMAADTFKRATDNDIFINHEYFNFLPDLFMYMLGTGGKVSFVNFSDSFYELDLSYLMAVLGSSNHHPVSSWYIHEFTNGKLDNLVYLKSIPVPIDPDSFYKNEGSRVFPLIGWAALRSGWKRDDHLLAFQSSLSAKDHNHFDQNNFVLHVAGEWLLTNPGYQDYVEGPRREFTLGTVGHNSMLVDKVGQSRRGKSQFIDWYSSKNYSFVSGEASGAYDGRVSSWQRKMIHMDQRYFVIVDSVVKAKTDSKLSFLYHTASKVIARKKSLSPGDQTNDDWIEVRGEHASVSLCFCYPEGSKKELKQYPGAEQYGTYLDVTSDGVDTNLFQVTLLFPNHDQKSRTQVTYFCEHSDGLFLLIVENTIEGVRDYLLVNKENRNGLLTTKNGETAMNSQQGWISWEKGKSSPTKFAMINGSQLMTSNQLLVQSKNPICLSGSFEKESARFHSEVEKQTEVRIKAPQPIKVSINDSVQAETFVYHEGFVELDLVKGSYDIVFFY